MKVALTGVTGHLGAAVLRELRARNYSVKALVRSGDQRSCAGIPVELSQGNLLNKDTLIPFMQGCDMLIHSAAVISINGDPDGMVHLTNVEGTRIVFEAARQSGIKRVVYIGSIHAYRQTPCDEVLDEKRTLVGEDAFAYDRSKRAGQEIALAMNQPAMEVVVVNPTAIMGPFDFKPSKAGQAMIDILTGRMPFVIRGGFDFCDSRDVARGVVNALTMGRAGEAYLLSGKWHSMHEVASVLADVSGRRIPVMTIPPFVAKAGLPFARIWGWLRNKEPLFTNEALEAVFHGNKRISNEKARRELNYVSRPLEDTLRDTWQWYKDNGYLA